MRKAIAAILGLAVLGALYLGPVARRRALLRGAACLAVGGLFTLVAMSSMTTPAANAFKAATPDPAALSRISTTVVAGHGLTEAATIVFSERVDPARVAAALHVTPALPVRLGWSPDGTLLHVTPLGHWAPATLYTLSLATTAVGLDGASLPNPLSAVFLTRPLTVASVTVDPAPLPTPDPTPAVTLSFSTPVTAAAVAGALTVTPAVAGRVTTVGPPQDVLNTMYVWQPTEPLTPGTTYAVRLSADLPDADGVDLAAGATASLSAPARPLVVRTRPLAGATGVALDQGLSVRFSQAMDHASTQAAFHVSGVADAAQAGRFSWAEGDTVLVWTPTAQLAYGTRYTITIGGSARALVGTTIGDGATPAATVSFTTLPKPKPAPRPVARADKPKPTGGGTTSAPLYSVEKYFLSLINCDHTGGWVSGSGVCTGRGSNGHAALTLSATISNGASRPWAKYLAQTSQLYHGDPAGRLAAIGYSGAWWGENLAWWSGTPTGGAIQAVLFFQGEKAAKGGHYLNMMDSRGRAAGVGAWQANGRVVFCIDFWA